MKKMMLLLAVVGCSIYANAQIEKGDSMITLALGVSPTFYSGNGFEASLPPIEAAYEYAISDNITVGGFAGIATAEFRSAGFGYDYTYILAGGLGNYHFVNSETFDVYVGAKLGYVNVSSKEVGAAFGINAESSGILFGGQLGARYWITETIAINAEAGYGVAALRLGVSFSI